MYTIREFDIQRDKSAVIRLLAATFQTSRFQFSEEYFDWKHLQNPFGRSVGFVAVQAEEIIGVRLFMRWNFQSIGKPVRALRPVDTATHPEWQGKGIFRALTIAGIHIWEPEVDLVFNTPNKNSFPGYIKMGWSESVEYFRYYLNLANPLSAGLKLKAVDSVTSEMDSGNIAGTGEWEFFNWRYRDKRYRTVTCTSRTRGTLLVYRLERIKYIPVVILVDFLGDEQVLADMANGVCMLEGTPLYYFAGFGEFARIKNRLSLGRGHTAVITRQPSVLNELNFSLGDLEGII